MYLLYVKGRGYFDGVTKKSSVFECVGTDKKGKRKYAQTFEYKIKFRRDPDVVKNKSIFYDKQTAKNKIEEISTFIKKGDTVEEDISSYRHYLNRYLVDQLKKVEGKFTIVTQDVVIKKRTIRLDSRKFTHLRTHEDSQYNTNVCCDFCKTTFIDKEPMLVVAGMYYTCKNCIDAMHDQISTEYNKNPKRQDITDAWNMEMVSREL